MKYSHQYIFLIFTKCRACALSQAIAITAKVLIVDSFRNNRSSGIVVMHCFNTERIKFKELRYSLYYTYLAKIITHQGSIRFTSIFWDVNIIIKSFLDPWILGKCFGIVNRSESGAPITTPILLEDAAPKQKKIRGGWER